AHLDPADRIPALLEIRDLRRGIVRRAVQHRDRNHRGKIVGQAAGEEEIQSGMLAATRRVDALGRMPWIDRRADERGAVLTGSVLECVDERAARIERTGLNFADPVPDTVPNIL